MNRMTMEENIKLENENAIENANESVSENANESTVESTNESEIVLEGDEADNYVAELVKKAKKKGALKGSIITAVVMLLIIVLGLCGYLFVKVLTGAVPISALGNFSSGIIDNDVYKKAEGIYAVIENTYLNEVDEDAVRDGIYSGMMEALGDPYSVYYTREEYAEMMESASGSFEGIGAYLQQDPDTLVLTVSRPMKGSPSEAAGLLSGDIIYTVDGEDISNQDINIIVSKIKGPAGTEVVLGIKRGDKTFDVTVKRAVVHEMSVDGITLDEDEKIGYIQIASFEDDTANQFKAVLDELMDDGIERLIIDLRDNGGGYVDTCVDICDYILPDCNVVSTKDKHGLTWEYDSSDTDFIRMPIVLLVNGNTASASEIMTGALKDNDYATVVGTNTFGKGIVQEVLQLDDGSGIKITMSEYYTPSGECIHGKGIKPDYEIELDVDKYINEGVDNQLEKAKEIVMK